MSPVPTTATRERGSDRTAPLLPSPTSDLLVSLTKEIVVDWQLPFDSERKG